MSRTALVALALALPLTALADDVPLVEDWSEPEIEVVTLDGDPMDDLLGPAPVLAIPVAEPEPAGSFVLVPLPEPPPPPALVVHVEDVVDEAMDEVEEVVEEVREHVAEAVEEAREEAREAHARARAIRVEVDHTRRAEPPPPARPPAPPEPEVAKRDRREKHGHPGFGEISIGSTLVDGQPSSLVDFTGGWYLRRHWALGFTTGATFPQRVYERDPSFTARVGVVPSLVFGRGKRIRTHADLMLGWSVMAGEEAHALYSFALPRVGADLRVFNWLYLGGTVGYRAVAGSEAVQEWLGGPEAALTVRFYR